MTVTPDTNDLNRMTPDGVRRANLITLLMLCAKTLQVSAPGRREHADAAAVDECGKHLASLVFQLTAMHGDGHQLEADTLLLAKDLGFDVEQRYTSKVARA